MKKNEENKGLVGTTWNAIVDDDDWIGTINFATETSFSFIESEGGHQRTHSGIYSYVAPRIVLQMPDWSLTGTITGNMMVLVEEYCNECVYNFIKK
ncbi:MAG: hypothetical protein LBJ23_00560 [Tannerella sp.]|jgi:hypothetical protein|nr:hypothetical protein [Tannerella sp.]